MYNSTNSLILNSEENLTHFVEQCQYSRLLCCEKNVMEMERRCNTNSTRKRETKNDCIDR